jgi:hypothetical protein
MCFWSWLSLDMVPGWELSSYQVSWGQDNAENGWAEWESSWPLMLCINQFLMFAHLFLAIWLPSPSLSLFKGSTVQGSAPVFASMLPSLISQQRDVLSTQSTLDPSPQVFSGWDYLC